MRTPAILASYYIEKESRAAMTTIYYSYYTPSSASIPEICAQEHALGRSLLLHGLRELHGLALSAEQLDAALTAGPHGKPYLAEHPDIHFNITHCDGLAACAFSDRPVGVDAELSGYFAEVLVDKALSADEKKVLETRGLTETLRREWFFRFWTLKEAYVKMTGTGVDVPLREISFSFDGAQDGLDDVLSDLPQGQAMASGQSTDACFGPPQGQTTPSGQRTDVRSGLPHRQTPSSGQNADALSGSQISKWLPEAEDPRKPYVIRCSDPGARCFQKMLETGHILSVCTG